MGPGWWVRPWQPPQPEGSHEGWASSNLKENQCWLNERLSLQGTALEIRWPEILFSLLPMLGSVSSAQAVLWLLNLLSTRKLSCMLCPANRISFLILNRLVGVLHHNQTTSICILLFGSTWYPLSYHGGDSLMLQPLIQTLNEVDTCGLPIVSLEKKKMKWQSFWLHGHYTTVTMGTVTELNASIAIQCPSHHISKTQKVSPQVCQKG